MNPRTRETFAPANGRPLMDSVPILLRPAETARLLAISPRKLWELTNQGALPALRIGRCLRYSRDALMAWVEKQATR